MKKEYEIATDIEMKTPFVIEECGDIMWEEVLIEKKYPLPPFTLETALQKVKAAEEA